MSTHVIINHTEYPIIENMGYIHDRGAYGKVIDFHGTERVVLKIGGKWELAKTEIKKSSPATGQ